MQSDARVAFLDRRSHSEQADTLSGGPFQFDSEEEHRSIIHGSTDWRYRNPLQPFPGLGNKPAHAESDIRDFILTRPSRASLRLCRLPAISDMRSFAFVVRGHRGHGRRGRLDKRATRCCIYIAFTRRLLLYCAKETPHQRHRVLFYSI
jgi:hypothetical protein